MQHRPNVRGRGGEGGRGQRVELEKDGGLLGKSKWLLNPKGRRRQYQKKKNKEIYPPGGVKKEEFPRKI